MAKKSKRRRARRRPGGGASRGGQASERALVREAVAEIRRRAGEAHDPATPPERVAAILAAEFDGMPAPHCFVRVLAERGSRERAVAVGEQLALLAPGSVTALTFQAEAAIVLDEDRERACRLLDEALELDLEPGAIVPLGFHLLDAGRALEALELAVEELLDDPLDGAAQRLQASALAAIHERAQAGEDLAAGERATLEHFSDRAPIYRLRDALRQLVQGDPELLARQAQTVLEWLQSVFGDEEKDVASELLGSSETELDAEREALVAMAVEHSWRQEPDDGRAGEDLEALSDEELLDRDERDPDLSESRSPLALLARGQSTPAELADAAADWHETCCWGLWLLEDPHPAPGVWLTEIVSGARRYVEIAPEQIDGLARWSVLLGAIVFLDGVWHSTGASMSLSPHEGDSAASLVDEAATDLMRVSSGKRARGPRRRKAEPHGVLADLSEEPDRRATELIANITAALLPSLAGGIRHGRQAGPRLTNTDGQPLKMITAVVAIEGPLAAAAERLAEHPDFRREDDDGEETITWWGRQLSAAEREQMLESLRAQLQRDGEGELEIGEPEESQRWLRGRLRLERDGFEVDVNSEQRLQDLLALLDEVGLAPEVQRRSAIDPSQDLPLRGPLGPLGFGESPAAVDAWARHWPDQPTPALDGLSPRAAASREHHRARLEALLRTLEHDADHLQRRGRPVPDFHTLRAELAMERWWEPPASMSGPSRRRHR
ncbi:MAG: hypothetical protein ACYCUM_12940 [Solirubrobacteraceae bacterium]